MRTDRYQWLSDAPLVIAHRGASSVAPENTLPAFELALEAGADGIELDLKLTLDGIVVVHHDQTLDRTTDGTGLVSDHTWAQLQALDAGSKHHRRYRGTLVPRLSDV